MATIIDGKALAAKIRSQAKREAEQLRAEGVVPGLAVVLVGNDPASRTYVRAKHRDCEECGIPSFDYTLPEQTTQEELLGLLAELNARRDVAGILVQMPLPAHLDAEAVIAAIDPAKDVDGFHPMNLGKLVRGLPGLRPCTPAGVMRMLEEYGIDPAGKNAVVVGRSSIVGKPMSLMLLAANATVTVAHSGTADVAAACRAADILVVATGRAKMVTADWVKQGAVVIDVGMDRDEAGKLCGDVDYAQVEKIAGAITPVPGGVGPMTRAMLVENVVAAARVIEQSR